jgi:hypothetical protein
MIPFQSGNEDFHVVPKITPPFRLEGKADVHVFSKPIPPNPGSRRAHSGAGEGKTVVVMSCARSHPEIAFSFALSSLFSLASSLSLVIAQNMPDRPSHPPL